MSSRWIRFLFPMLAATCASCAWFDGSDIPNGYRSKSEAVRIAKAAAERAGHKRGSYRVISAELDAKKTPSWWVKFEDLNSPYHPFTIPVLAKPALSARR